MKYKLIRTVTREECHWLYRDFLKDEIVYLYRGCTYGCCNDSAYTIVEGKEPFFELPGDSVEEVI